MFIDTTNNVLVSKSYFVIWVYLDTHQLLTKNIIEVNPLPQGEVLNILCSPTENAITGCLAVIISSDNRSELPLYRMIQWRNTQVSVQNSLNVSIYGLRPNGNYTISLFEGLGNPPIPVQFPAVTEKFQLSNNHASMIGKGILYN